MSLLILSASDVDTLASRFQPRDLMILMAKTFAVFSDRKNPDKVTSPQRINIRTANHTVLFMPARIEADLEVGLNHADTTTTTSTTGMSRGSDAIEGGQLEGSSPNVAEGHTAIKIVSVPKHADPRGIPATTAVLDERSGAIRAIVNARKLTALRNAATSLLSTTLIGPSHPRTIVAFGAGKQIEAHLELHIRHFPSVEKCSIINRSNNDRATSLYASLKGKFPNTTFRLFISGSDNVNDGTKVRDAVSTADIIVCATSSMKPLFPSAWVRAGTHVILIGSYTAAMREVDVDLVHRARDTVSLDDLYSSSTQFSVLVDSREACMHEAGELLDAKVVSEQLVEIGELIPLSPSGDGDVQLKVEAILDMEAFDAMLMGRRLRTRSEDFEGPITIFKSVGVGIQDVAIAKAMVDEAEEQGVGTVLKDYDTEL